MSDDGDFWAQVKGRRQRASIKRRDVALQDFQRAKAAAEEAGLELIKHTWVHYSLQKPDEWRIEVYPGNGRIWSPDKEGPYLRNLPSPWRLLDVVLQAVKEGRK